jgi:hypothetical protein
MPWLVVIHQPRHFPRDPPATCPAPKRGTKYGAALWSPNHRGFPVICWKPHAGVSSIGCKLEQFAPVLQPKGDTSSPFARVCATYLRRHQGKPVASACSVLAAPGTHLELHFAGCARSTLLRLRTCFFWLLQAIG